MIQNKQGYLVLELIIALFLIGTILACIPYAGTINEDKIVANFVEKLERDIVYTKLQSSTTLDLYTFTFETGYYTITNSTKTYSQVVLFDKQLSISTHVGKTVQIIYGGTSKVLTFFVYCGQDVYQLTIQEKSGNIHVVKQ